MAIVRIPPYSQEAEEALIGCALIDNSIISKAIAWVSSSNFYFTKNSIIWDAIIKLNNNRQSVDIITIVNELRDAQKLDEIGGAYYITGLSGEAPVSANAERYAEIIHEKSAQRTVIAKARELTEKGYENHEETEKMLISLKNTAQELLQLRPSRRKGVDVVVPETIEMIRNGGNVIPFGFKPLDNPAGGMTRKEISVLGGRPSHGKTTLVLNIVSSLIGQGFKVALFNREMSNVEFMKKLFVLESKKLSYNSVRMSELTEPDYTEINNVSAFIKKKYNKEVFFMYDEINSLEQAVTEIKRIEPDVFIDDYIQLINVNMGGGKNRDRRFEIDRILREYKWLSKEINAAGLLVSQLSRDIEQREDQRPRMSDYSEAGTIEQIAENCLFVFYGFVHDHTLHSQFESEIISAKTRYGIIGRYPVGFNGDRCRFYETKNEAMEG